MLMSILCRKCCHLAASEGAYHHVASVPALLSRPMKMRATQAALLPQQLGGHHRQKRDHASESKCHRNEMKRSP
jgi:hypothetical protein